MLCTKIRNQAKELAALTERLQEEAAYSRLVEKRLVELDPEHSLPVTPHHLGRRSPESTIAHRSSGSVGGLGRGYHLQKADQLSNEEHDHDDGLRQGYEAAQARLRDAAQLIRTLREALESRGEFRGDSHVAARAQPDAIAGVFGTTGLPWMPTWDADANAAANRARKYQREADDLRRRLETSGGNVSRASKGGSGGGRVGENQTSSSPLGGEQGHGRELGIRFVDDDRARQHQQHVELSKDVERLEQKLREQREATTAARTEANGLHETLKQLQQSHHVGNLSSQREGAADDAKANAAELARQLARARSTAESSREENKNLRLQLRELGGGGSGHGRRGGGNGSGNSSHISKTMPRSTSIASSSSGGHAIVAAAALGGRHTPAAGSKPALACELGGTRAANVEEEGGADRGGNELEAEKEALLDYVQDLLGRIKGLEAACASLERERGDSSINLEKTRKDLQQKEKAIAQIEDLQKTEKVERVEKEEMGRLYNELLKQLKTAEEEKEKLQPESVRERSGAYTI
ncbi:hypothetical protein Esi_0022_0083 [Ectocarpus siliculosus]|uniref:Uncharacterized protein n=1 Tax=Ectocarpus siliculosus TaxID=2880 RepID=D8LIF5_ECTSI|nr:hypothetical protein Esi_0022_0083 [Ectocarpus siliculosus]|eukprot:CBN79994.1 hypothetical protein Esi_0022_0083 [Ectocarpus siliculosus]